MLYFINDYFILFLILITASAVFVSYLYYRRIKTEKQKKIFLIILRSSYLIILLSIFLQPVISTIKQNKDLIDLILIDNSRSTNLQYRNEPVFKQISEVYNQFNLNKNRFKILYINPLLDSSKIFSSDNFNFFESNPNYNFYNLRSSYTELINSVSIISDGMFNKGNSPIYQLKALNINTITIGVGDSIQKKDLVLSNLLYNDKVISGFNTAITARVKAYHAKGEVIQISLYKENVLIKSDHLLITSDNEYKEFRFDFIENQEGYIKYRVTITPIQDEITQYNNFEDAIIRFFPKKLNILYISSGPGYDNSFVSKIINRINSYKFTIRTLKNQNSFYEGDIPDLNDYGLVILFDFPSQKTSNELLNNITGLITNLKLPVFLFAGKQTDFSKLSVLNDIMPFAVTSLKSTEAKINIRQTDNEKYKLFLKMPELYKNVSGIIQKPGSETALIDVISGDPVLIFGNNNGIKNGVFLGYGFWRWKLNNLGTEKDFENLLFQAIDNTITKERIQELTLFSDKKVFDLLEFPVIYAQLNVNGVNIVNSNIICKLTSDNKDIMTDLKFIYSDHKYVLTFPKLPKGDYFLEARSEHNGKIDIDNIRFIVDSTNLEFKTTASNFKLLKEISDNTGGLFITGIPENNKTYYNFIDSLNNIHQVNNSNEVKLTNNLRENVWVLTLLILFFSIEWIIRKRNNIP